MPTEGTLSEAFLTEFIDDLYAEYAERLEFVQRDLLALETLIGQPLSDKSLLDALLRHLHTLKGLSGTINLKPAEELAHHLESYLRAVRQEQVELSVTDLEILITGAKELEQIITAHRTQQALPEINSTLNALALALSGTTVAVSPKPLGDTVITPPPDLTASEQARFNTAVQQGFSWWQVEFIPSSNLAERGINVNMVRQRLEQLGRIIQSKPLIPPEGPGFVFEFLVATPPVNTDFSEWQLEGMTYTPYAATLPPLLESKPDELTILPATGTPTTHPNQTAEVPDEIPLILNNLALGPATNLVRVDMARLDELMRLIGELVTSRARQENVVKQLKLLLPSAQWRLLQETNLVLERQLRALREGVMRVRMVPMGTAFERMKFVVRDLIRNTQKQVKLELQGQETEIDKLVVDRMMDPLLHLIRNAVSHGIETPTERLACGKSAEGTIRLQAYTAGEAVIVEVEDDGQGIAIEQVIAQARSQQLLAEDATLQTRELLELLCRPGFTTQSCPDLNSGRGIGMDVVKNTVSLLGGFLTLDTKAEQGTKFTIQLPLTLAIVDALIVAAGEQHFAVPQLSIREVIEVEMTAVTQLENNEIIAHRSEILMLVHLTQVFGIPVTPSRKKFYVLVVGGNSGVGIVVERLLGKHEIVVQPLNDSLVQVPGIAGATELGNGKIVLILDVAQLGHPSSLARRGKGELTLRKVS